jgi:hypothetical protein
MSIWFLRSSALDTDKIRLACERANVSWKHQTPEYKKNGVGFSNGDASDASKIQSELERILGYPPVQIDEPTIETNQTDQTQ